MEFLYLLVLLAISIALHLRLKIKIEQSIFFSVCMYFIIMLISGLITNLSVGYYVIITIAVSSLSYIIYKSIKKDTDLWAILTPGLSIFILAYTVYYFSTQGALLHLWDEATHWGTAAKKMYFGNDLWTSGLQTIATPLFNQVMLKITGYSESALYLSQWTIYLACITLPLSNVRWKKSYVAVLYTLALIFAVSSIFQDGNLTLYADGILGLFFGSLFISWFIQRDQGVKRYLWALPGIFMLVQIKSGSGASLAAMLLIFMLISDALIGNKDISPKMVYLKNLRTFIITATVIAGSNALISYLNKGFLSFSDKVSSNNLSTSLIFIVFSCLLAISTLLFIIYTVNIFNKKTKIKFKNIINKLLVSFLVATFIALISVLFYSAVLRPDFDVRTTVLNFLTAFQKTKMFSVAVVYLIVLIVVLYLLSILLSKKKNRRELIVFYIVSVFLSGLYLYGVIYAYLTSFSLGEAVNMASFDRYIGTCIMFAVIFIFAPALKTNDTPFKSSLLSYLPLVALTIYMAISFTPAYKVTNITSEEALVFRQTEISGANYVKTRVSNDKKVFLIIQDDKGFVFNWMRYEFAPITTNGGLWSFGDDGGWNFHWNAVKLEQFLIDAKYDYLYLFRTDEFFDKEFKSLFGDDTPQSKTLYKFNHENEIVFTKVD